MHARTCTCTHRRTYPRTRTCTHAHAQMHARTCICTHPRTYARAHKCTHAHALGPRVPPRSPTAAGAAAGTVCCAACAARSAAGGPGTASAWPAWLHSGHEHIVVTWRPRAYSGYIVATSSRACVRV